MDYYEEALSLLSSITTHHISDNIWPALPLLSEILYAGDDGGVDYFVDMMPALHNFITVDSQKFFTESNLQLVYGMLKFVLDSTESGEDAETHALKTLEVLIFQAGNKVPGVIKNSLALAYERGFSENSREIKTDDTRVMCLMVFLAALYADQTAETFNTLNELNWMHAGLSQWIEDFEIIQGIHDRRLTLLMVAKFLATPDLPLAIKENLPRLLSKCIELFKNLGKAYEMKAIADGSENDSDDEESLGSDMESDDEDNMNRGDIDQLNDDEDDVDEEGKNYRV